MLRLGYGLIFSGGGVNRKCEGVGKTLLSSWFYGDFEVMQLQSAWSKYESLGNFLGRFLSDIS